MGRSSGDLVGPGLSHPHWEKLTHRPAQAREEAAPRRPTARAGGRWRLEQTDPFASAPVSPLPHAPRERHRSLVKCKAFSPARNPGGPALT